MIRRIRFLFPDYAFLGAFLLIMLPFEIMILIGKSPFGVVGNKANVSPIALAGFGMRNVLLVLAAVVYAILRIFVRHPFVNPTYREWLAGTPYHRGASLPFAPVELNWRDALMLGVIIAPILLHTFELPIYVPIAVFILTYSFMASTILPFTKPWQASYALQGLIAPGIFLWHTPLVAAICTVSAGIVAAASMRMSMWEFPWDDTIKSKSALNREDRGFGSTVATQAKTQMRDFHIYSAHPIGADSGITPIHAVLLPLVFGWWMFCGNSMLEARLGNIGQGLIIFPCLATAIFTLIRVMVYLPRYRSPISFWGRLRTGRLIIPGYDKVFLAPLLALGLQVAAGFQLTALGMVAWHAWTVGMVAALFVLTALGPTLQSWQLTGMCQIRPWAESILRASRTAQERSIRWQTTGRK